MIVTVYRVRCSGCMRWLSPDGPVPKGYPDIYEFAVESVAQSVAVAEGWVFPDVLLRELTHSVYCPLCAQELPPGDAGTCPQAGAHIARGEAASGDMAAARTCPVCRARLVWVLLDGEPV